VVDFILSKNVSKSHGKRVLSLRKKSESYASTFMKPIKKRRYPPPSDNIIQEIKLNLSRGVFLETACALAGVPIACLLYWIEQGRLGEVEFMRFTDMVDSENSKLAKEIMDFMYDQAFTNRDFKAMKFLYENRLKHREKRVQEKIDKIEDRIEAETVMATSSVLTEEELTELEANVIEKEAVH